MSCTCHRFFGLDRLDRFLLCRVSMQRAVRSLTLIVSLGVMFFYDPAFAGDDFNRVDLPGGISVETPANWEVLSSREIHNVANRAAVIMERAGAEPASAGKITLLALNSDSKPIGAKFRISTIPSPEFTAQDLAGYTQADLDGIKVALLEQSKEFGRAGGIRIISVSTVDRTELNGKPTLLTTYRRDSIGDPGDVWTVMAFQTPLPGRVVETTVSWRTSESARWFPTVKRLVTSLTFAD